MREVGRGAARRGTAGGSAGSGTGAAGTDVAAAPAAAATVANGPAYDQFHLGVQATLVDDIVHLVGTLVVQPAAIPLDDLVAWSVHVLMDDSG